MNILVIGNGFDIAHGLPTSYQQFLSFVTEENDICGKLQKNGLNPKESASAAREIKELCAKNYWIEHFQKISNCGENWIDFESEISMVIQKIDAVRKIVDAAQRKPFSQLGNDCLLEIYNKYSDIYVEFEIERNAGDPELISRIKKKLLDDLNRLIRSLEIYLCQYVNRIDITNNKLELLNTNRFNYVLNFNYTDTFERLYGNVNIKFTIFMVKQT